VGYEVQRVGVGAGGKEQQQPGRGRAGVSAAVRFAGVNEREAAGRKRDRRLADDEGEFAESANCRNNGFSCNACGNPLH
jgi:hypothetical protein